ncbi:MAG: hypothetical protein ACR2IV_05850 [Bryobacteraceae bacterium]
MSFLQPPLPIHSDFEMKAVPPEITGVASVVMVFEAFGTAVPESIFQVPIVLVSPNGGIFHA